MAENPLNWLGVELNRCLPTPGANVVLFGSAVMLLHGLRESIGDVDLFVTREAWATLVVKHPDRWKVRFPTPGDPPLLEWRGEKVVHAFVRWTSRDTWMQVEDAWRRREAVQGWPCVPLELVRRWKVEAARWNPGSPTHTKHLRDVELIDAHLAAQKAA